MGSCCVMSYTWKKEEVQEIEGGNSCTRKGVPSLPQESTLDINFQEADTVKHILWIFIMVKKSILKSD